MSIPQKRHDIESLFRLKLEILEEYRKFNEAEQNLLKASIAIIPEVNVTLEQLNNTTLKNKAKWISIVLKLDANTIPAKKLARA